MAALIRDALVEGKAETVFPLDVTVYFDKLRIEDDLTLFPTVSSLT